MHLSNNFLTLIFTLQEGEWHYLKTGKPIPEWIWAYGGPHGMGDCGYLGRVSFKMYDDNCDYHFIPLCQRSL